MNKESRIIADNLLQHFCTFISNTMGWYFPKENWHDLEKKLISLSHLLKYKRVSDCIIWLSQAPLTQEKIDILSHHFTVGETYFFRDEQSFHILKNCILPELIHQRLSIGVPYLHIWCAACCTGEEPYSLAILLHQLIPDIKAWDIKIVGTDINDHFLHKARKGQYKAWSFRGTSEDIKRTYFIKEKDQTYSLIQEIKQMVSFEYLNLIDETYPFLSRGIEKMDIILCNNVLIYFSPSQIKKVVERLSNTLAEEGILMVAPVEIPYINTPPLVPVKYYNSSLTVFKNSIPPPAHLTDFSSLIQKAKYSIKSPLEKKEAKRIRNPEGGSKESMIREEIRQGHIEQALAHCEQCLVLDKFNPMIYYLRAHILQELNHFPEAIESLKRALYLDSNFVMAYFALGNLLLAQGKTKEAKSVFKNVINLLSHYTPDSLLPGDNISAERLSGIVKGIMGSNGT